MWIFGYGSLIFRPGFDFAESRPACARGWARRFWQGSTDHRGLPGAPGRVVTLVPAPGEACWGVVFRTDGCPRLLAALDHRERGGYQRQELTVDAGGRALTALTWVAAPDNPNFLGPAPLDAMIDQIAAARGPSGRNDEYLLRLAEELARHGLDDAHVEELASGLNSRRSVRR